MLLLLLFGKERLLPLNCSVHISTTTTTCRTRFQQQMRWEMDKERVRKREKGFCSCNQLPLYFELLKGIVIDVLPMDKALLLFTSQTTAASVSWFVSSLEEEEKNKQWPHMATTLMKNLRICEEILRKLGCKEKKRKTNKQTIKAWLWAMRAPCWLLSHILFLREKKADTSSGKNSLSAPGCFVSVSSSSSPVGCCCCISFLHFGYNLLF